MNILTMLLLANSAILTSTQTNASPESPTATEAPAKSSEKAPDAEPPKEQALKETPSLAEPPLSEKPFELTPDKGPKAPSAEAIAAQTMIDGALKKIKPDIVRDGNIWKIDLGARMALIITDPSAERMRIMVPIADAENIEEAALKRMMQANFDSALDARYAIAQGVVWGTFIHPLTSLTENDFLSGLAQTFKVAENFGTTYSSDVVIYGGGDSNGIFEDVIERLKQLEADTAKTTV